MKPYDPEGRQGPSKPLPDAVNLVEYVYRSHLENCTDIQAQARGSRRDPIRAQGPPCSARCPPAGSAADSSAVERMLAGLSVIGLYHTPMDWLLYCPCCTRGPSCSSSSDYTLLHPAYAGAAILVRFPAHPHQRTIISAVSMRRQLWSAMRNPPNITSHLIAG